MRGPGEPTDPSWAVGSKLTEKDISNIEHSSLTYSQKQDAAKLASSYESGPISNHSLSMISSASIPSISSDAWAELEHQRKKEHSLSEPSTASISETSVEDENSEEQETFEREFTEGFSTGYQEDFQK